MNATQRNYLAGRMKTLLASRLTALQEEYKVPALVLSDEDRAKLLRTGKVKVRGDVTEVRNHASVGDVFDFSKFARPVGYRTGYPEAEKALRAEAARVEDRIMLGDSDAALLLLADFANETPAWT